MTAKLERLVEAGIQLVPAEGVSTHFVFLRGEFVALVERKGDGFGGIGAPGLLTGHGIAMLVWRGGKAYFVTKGHEQEAGADQVEALRSFSADLSYALGGADFSLPAP